MNLHRIVKRRLLVLAVVFIAIVAIFAISQNGSSAHNTPSQTFVNMFNSMAVGSQAATSSSDKAFILRAGRGFCSAKKHGVSDTQAKNDMSVLGITNADLAEMIRLAAQSKGSLCPV